MLHKRFILVRRLLKATGEALVVFGVPLLQSVAGVCSDDKNYLTNREEADFEEILSAGVDDVDPEGEDKATIAFTKGKSSAVGCRLRGCEDSLVHITAAAYANVAAIFTTPARRTWPSTEHWPSTEPWLQARRVGYTISSQW